MQYVYMSATFEICPRIWTGHYLRANMAAESESSLQTIDRRVYEFVKERMQSYRLEQGVIREDRADDDDSDNDGGGSKKWS